MYYYIILYYIISCIISYHFTLHINLLLYFNILLLQIHTSQYPQGCDLYDMDYHQ